MENIIEYYFIIGLSFVITSYIVTYRPAMRRTATKLIDLLNIHGTSDEFLVEKVQKFVSWPYRIVILSIYSILVFLTYPIMAIGTITNNESIISGFSNGIYNGLLEIEDE